MKEQFYSGSFAGKELYFAFRHEKTAAHFKEWLLPCDPVEPAIRVLPSDYEKWIWDYGMHDDDAAEFGMSVYRASDALLLHDRCVIHSAAMLWRGKAWLFTADSGTGKSTQLWQWKELYGDEVCILNGDKPILRVEQDGRISVHPSPWKGKETWGDDKLSAPLGGLILLRQDKQNFIHRSVPIDTAARLLSCFFSMFETAETVHRLCRIEEAILAYVPIYILSNLGDAESARLTHDTLLQEEKNDKA